MYAKGQGVDKNDTEAFKWFTKAAEQGNAQAQCSLGVMYVHGQGVTQDDTEAFKWFTKAAEQGEAGAQANLGLMYAHGRGVARDYKEVLMWVLESGQIKTTTQVKNFIKRYLSPTNTTITENNDHVFTQKELADIRDYIDYTKGREHLLHTVSYNAKGNFIENNFPIPSLHEAYNTLCVFERKAINVINLLMEVETGFMVDCVMPTTAFNNLNTISRAVSVVDIKDTKFMLFGHANHKIWSEVSAFITNPGVKEAFDALNAIEKIYTSKHMKELHDLREESLKKLGQDDSLKDALINAFNQKASEIPSDDDTIDNAEIPENNVTIRGTLETFDYMVNHFFKGNALKARNDKFMDEQFGE
jgi:hypothetical protein